MQLVAFSDESGRIGKDGLGNLVMGGFIASGDYWVQFCEEWHKILNKYHAPYFHFRELNLSERSKPKNPYHGWSNEKTDDFIYDLAIVAGRQAVPFGSNVFLAEPGHKNYRSDPWKQTFEKHFDHFMEVMTLHWPNFQEPVHFFFDRQENETRKAELNAAIKTYKKKDVRFGNYEFDEMGKKLPLQAADMFAYALRQSGERAFKTQKRQHNRILDLILRKNSYPINHALSLPEHINQDAWESLVRDFIKHKRKWDADRAARGLPKTEYFPALHFSNKL